MVKNSTFKIFFCLIVLLLVSSGLKVQAAVLSLESESGTSSERAALGQVFPGQTFIVESRISLAEAEEINYVVSAIKYPESLVEGVEVSFGDSILSIFPTSPIIDQDSGLIEFSGGIPGGYSGRISGDPNRTNLLAKIIFRVKTEAPLDSAFEINYLPTSQVLLNDGLGTKANLELAGKSFSISQLSGELPPDQWQELLKSDTTPPESFKVELKSDPLVFNGQYFISFHTTDKQTRVVRYEVFEGTSFIEGQYYVATSPYLLKDQKLESFIKVKAVDAAGNKWVEVVEPTNWPEQNKFELKKQLLWLLIAVLMLLILALVTLKLKKIKLRKN